MGLVNLSTHESRYPEELTDGDSERTKVREPTERVGGDEETSSGHVVPTDYGREPGNKRILSVSAFCVVAGNVENFSLFVSHEFIACGEDGVSLVMGKRGRGRGRGEGRKGAPTKHLQSEQSPNLQEILVRDAHEPGQWEIQIFKDELQSELLNVEGKSDPGEEAVDNIEPRKDDEDWETKRNVALSDVELKGRRSSLREARRCKE